MTDEIDAETEALLDIMDWLEPDQRAQIIADRKANAETVARLEAKYADRGLKFAQSFAGSVPVQAYGYLDGYHFYFRFRHNWGNLRLGPYDREMEELYALRINEDHAVRAAEDKARILAEGDTHVTSIMDDFYEGDFQVAEDDGFFMPRIVVKASGVEGHTPGDDYNGSLDADEAYDIFVQLVDSLEDIAEEDQLGGFERVWIYEGRPAAEAWQAKWNEEHKEEIEARIAEYQAWRVESDARRAKLMAELENPLPEEDSRDK